MKKIKMSDLYIAKEGENQLIVSKDKFKNLIKLVDLLNTSGFILGTGHDGLKIKKNLIPLLYIDLECYTLICTPYVGHIDQCVQFLPLAYYLSLKK